MLNKKTVEDIDVKGKKVLVRVDFNVPINAEGVIQDHLRIQAALPTIEYLLDHNARVILMSHLGRPKGEVMEKLSLKPVHEYLKQALNVPVYFVDNCIGSNVESKSLSLNNKEVLLLENLRFHKEEKENDPDFAKKLAKLADIYVNNAFGTSHRSHASMVGVTSYLPSVAGHLIIKELKHLVGALQEPQRPFTAIIGGKKIKGKIRVLQHLVEKADNILIGGGMTYTFLKAQGKEIGDSILDESSIEIAKNVLQAAKHQQKNLVLPVDVVIAESFDNEAATRIVSVDNIPPNWEGLDIGPNTISQFSKMIKKSKLCAWNGPVGVFEMSNFANGTKKIAKVLGKSDCDSIVGGGDTAAAVRKFGYESKMTHISTGGGASLKLLEGSKLPAVECLDDK